MHTNVSRKWRRLPPNAMKLEDKVSTPEGALNQCFGGGHTQKYMGWNLQSGSENCWFATFDSQYAEYINQYFIKHGATLKTQCRTQKSTETSDQVTVYLTNDAPIELTRKITTACKRLGHETFIARYVTQLATKMGGPG